ncbi:MAG: hypothetical protein KAQ62_02925 [Cyclobacteriaceae bacterium]|nr:hypothetical protein [Cyclobacteriaceae bacterium]MCK5210239.1 hypothetical protein [Cyclobacteriaceae bacterium]MCK5367469.1 hypothetical protein [Cyclobacteriaceae bacterium]MCK5703477.1 hypothetical protein [Cyclobacteriaceae bacterium]
MTFKTAYKVLLVLFLFLFITQMGCSRKKKKTNRLQKFESELWIQDKNGCTGERMILKNQLLSLKHNMRGFKSSEIESYLGKPDAQELYTRSQRYYIYFMEPGPKCDNAKENPQALFVRFSAIGVANEFTIKPL